VPPRGDRKYLLELINHFGSKINAAQTPITVTACIQLSPIESKCNQTDIIQVRRLTGKLKKPSGMCMANCGCIIQSSKLE